MSIRPRWIVFFALLMILGIGLGGLLSPASAQDGPSQDLINSLIQFLRTQLGKPISALDNYTYQRESFPDSALGCPEAGQKYTPGPFPGYKFLLTVQGITYDVRAVTDNSAAPQFLLCSKSEIKQTVTVSTYRSRLFSLSYPTPWAFTEQSGSVFFGLGPTPVCAQPGMVVASLGDSGDKTPDALLDDYAKTVSNGQFDPKRVTIRRLGRSALYVAPCADGKPRQYRVTIFVAYGRAYRISQFAPQSAFSQWADVYLQILETFGPTTIGSAGNGQAVAPPPVSPLALVAHIFGGNVYVGTLTDLPGAPITEGASEARPYKDVTVSPRGDQLAFIDPFERALYIAPAVRGGQPHKVAENLVTGDLSGYPPAWSPAGDEIAYLAGQDTPGETTYTLMAIKADGSASRELGKVTVPPGACPEIGTPDPAERLYAAEAGYKGNYKATLLWTRSGTIYYSLRCGLGLGRIAQTGGSGEALDPPLFRAHLSPDQTEFVGLLDSPDGAQKVTLVRVRLADQQVVALKTSGLPDQTAWSTDGQTIYYSTVTLKNDVKLDDQAERERGQTLLGAWPFRYAVYDVALHSLNLSSGADEELFRADGRGIGRIAPSPDGVGALFTFETGAALMIEAFNNNVSAGEIQRQRPSSELFWVMAGSPPQEIAVSAEPTWGGLGSAPAPTPTAGPGKKPGLAPTTTATATPAVTVSPTSPFGAPLPTNTPRATQAGGSVG
jgi:hypothetical protein